MSWTVVIFEETNDEPELVQVVPSTWITGDMCFWPPFPADKLKTAIKRCLAKDDKWPSFKIRVLRNSTYDDYGLAQKKAKKAEMTSDLNSEQEDSQRILKPNRYFLTDSDSDDEMEMLHTKKLKTFKKVQKPPAPSKNCLLSNYDPSSQPKDNFGSTIVLDKDLASGEECHNQENGSRPSVDSRRKDVGAANAINNSDAANTQRNYLVGEFKTQQKTCSECRSCTKSEKKQMYLITQLLLDLNEKMDSVLRTLQVKKHDDNKEDKDLLGSLQINLPVTTEEDLIKLEIALKDDNKYKALAINFAKMGGGTLVEFIRRMLSSLIGDDIAIKYSFQGRKEKKAFKELAVSNLVIEAAEKTGLSSTKKQIEDAIAAWLKRAPERKRRGIEKRNNQPDCPRPAQQPTQACIQDVPQQNQTN